MTLPAFEARARAILLTPTTARSTTKYTKNRGNIISYRPSQPQSITGWRGFGVSYPLQFFPTDLYDIVRADMRPGPSGTVINFDPATG